MKIKHLDENYIKLQEETITPPPVEMTSKDPETAEPATAEAKSIVTNALTTVLDQALDDCMYAKGENTDNYNCNVLVTGLPGSSKTQTIKAWCARNGCNLYYLDAKNPDLQLLTSGAASIDKSDPKHPEVETAYSRALNKLDRPRSILFLDELNRQVKEYMRGSLLTLVADRMVAGDTEDGFRKFDNMLFTIAAINPAAPSDKGATDLNAAEDRRFYYHVEFNSEVPTTKSYFNWFYDEKLKALVKENPDMSTEAAWKKFDSFCLRQWIGNAIISAKTPKFPVTFKYTTVDEYLAKSEKGQIMCQSTITELIDHSRGEIDRLIRDINASNLTPSGKSMLLAIVENLTLPNIDALRNKKIKDLGLGIKYPTTIEDKPVEPETTETEDDEFGEYSEDDIKSGVEDDVHLGAKAIDLDAETRAKVDASESDVWKTISDSVGGWFK